MADYEDRLLDHEYDGIREFDNDLPRWWLWLFYITLIFAVGYLALYPGLGSFQGVLGWSSQGSQYTAEMDRAAEKYDPIFKQYAAVAVGPRDLPSCGIYQSTGVPGIVVVAGRIGQIAADTRPFALDGLLHHDELGTDAPRQCMSIARGLGWSKLRYAGKLGREEPKPGRP